jgi:hypothetical protein
MTPDDRMTTSLFPDIIGVLEHHGFRHHDDQHTGQHTGHAIGVIRDLAHVYEGTRDTPYGTYPVQAQPPGTTRPAPEAGQSTVLLAAAGIRTIVAALDDAADYKRDRAEMCADCPGQSCVTCQSRLNAAETCTRMADQMIVAAEPSQAAAGREPDLTSEPQPSAGLEAGQ